MLHVIEGQTIDELTVKGIEYVIRTGEKIKANAGDALQSYSITYCLTNSYSRVPSLRLPATVRYFCKELRAYFNGDLHIDGGLSDASSYWRSLSSSDGYINSNYGYYVFHQKIEGGTQFEYITEMFSRSRKTRRALININQPHHKVINPKDFPCAISLLFYINYENKLCCDIYSRSMDLVWGLPYDLSFFSLINEIVCVYLNEFLGYDLQLGYTSIHGSFTQIYDKTRHLAIQGLEKYYSSEYKMLHMPKVSNVKSIIDDIYGGTIKSDLFQWIQLNSK